MAWFSGFKAYGANSGSPYLQFFARNLVEAFDSNENKHSDIVSLLTQVNCFVSFY